MWLFITLSHLISLFNNTLFIFISTYWTFFYELDYYILVDSSIPFISIAWYSLIWIYVNHVMILSFSVTKQHSNENNRPTITNILIRINSSLFSCLQSWFMNMFSVCCLMCIWVNNFSIFSLNIILCIIYGLFLHPTMAKTMQADREIVQCDDIEVSDGLSAPWGPSSIPANHSCDSIISSHVFAVITRRDCLLYTLILLPFCSYLRKKNRSLLHERVFGNGRTILLKGVLQAENIMV